MIEQELEKVLAETRVAVASFGPDSKLSNQDWRRKMHLSKQVEILERIKKARELHDLSREAHLTAYYNLLVNQGNMNPILNYFLRMRLKSLTWI